MKIQKIVKLTKSSKINLYGNKNVDYSLNSSE